MKYFVTERAKEHKKLRNKFSTSHLNESSFLNDQLKQFK